MKVLSLHAEHKRIETILKNALQRRIESIFVPWMIKKKEKKEAKLAASKNKFGKSKKKKAAPAATPAPANPPPKAPANALSPDKKKSDSKVQLDPLT